MVTKIDFYKHSVLPLEEIFVLVKNENFSSLKITKTVFLMTFFSDFQLLKLVLRCTIHMFEDIKFYASHKKLFSLLDPFSIIC